MLDLGLNDSDRFQQFTSTIRTIVGPVAALNQQIADMEQLPADSELARLRVDMGTWPPSSEHLLDLDVSLTTALQAGHDALSQISTITTQNITTSPIVFQSLLRTTLLAAARVIHVLLPSRPEDRLKHGKETLALEATAAIRGLKDSARFEELPGLNPPEGMINALSDQAKALAPDGRPPRETQMINKMLASVAEALHRGPAPTTSEAVLAEQVRWIWHTYSGHVHAYSWTQLLPSISQDRRLPGDLVGDLHQIASLLHLAQRTYLHRAASGSASSTEPLDFTTE